MIGLRGKELCSQRLRYRLLEEGDKAALFRLLRDREVTAPAGFLPAENEAAFDVFFDRLTQYGTGIAVLVGEVLIGYCHINPYRPDVEELKAFSAEEMLDASSAYDVPPYATYADDKTLIQRSF
mgnify:CR=1 FL=1